ncbi:MAG TPA: ABC transporter permease [Planctomycetota bacterium]|nr:ABC transporter permease [Planctomycetota bacterium]
MSAQPDAVPSSAQASIRVGSDIPFYVCMCLLGSTYVLLIAAMLIADLRYTTAPHLLQAFGSPEIRYAIKLSLISCTITTILSLWVAVPLGYLLSRHDFPGKWLVDALLDIPIVLPPLVIGLSLLILFQTPLFRSLDDAFQVTYAVPSVIVAQFAVACAFAVRTMRVTFDQISPRSEQVALTLGCSQAQAFWMVTLPEARRGILTAATLAWARSLGEFGPILIFSGATRMRTEVLSTTVFLELSVGNIEAAVAVSLLMIAAAVIVLTVVRLFGSDVSFGKAVEP